MSGSDSNPPVVRRREEDAVLGFKHGVCPDGRFITVAGEGGESDRRPIRVLDNWLALVRELSGE